jgi:hypothetical protein
MFRSGPAAPFVFGVDPASVRDDVLRIALSRHLMDGFTFMNGRIKGLAQNLKDTEGRHEEFWRQTNNHLNTMRADDTDTRRTERERFLWMENMLKTLLQQTDAYNRANKALLEAQHASRAETTLLRAEIETLTRKLEDYTMTPPPPSPAIPTSSPSAMEEMSLQLYGVQQGIEDVLDAVHNPVGKRKRSPNSEYDNTEPQSPTTR